MLEATRLRKRYGSLVALDRVGLTVRRGELVGFLGPNGAGKTTAMRAIMQLVQLDGGSVTWDGRPVDAQTRQRFGYMPAERGMYPRMRIREHLVYYGRLSGLTAADATSAADHWLERLGLSERANDNVQDLSSGNQQRVQLALALINQPELLVLDEPFSGLDPVAVDVLRTVLTDLVDDGAALLLSSHQLDLVASLCNKVAIVDSGRIVLDGNVDDLRSAADHRLAEIEFADPIGGWDPSVPSVTVTRRGERSLQLRCSPDTDPAAVLADAGAHATVRAFSFEPPDLSAVFLDTVGRTAMNAAPDPDAAPGAASGTAPKPDVTFDAEDDRP